MGKINEQRACDLLLEHDNILIISHQSPDGDTLGCAFALVHGLKSIGKKVRMICSDNVPQKFSYLCKDIEPTEFEPDYIVAVDIADKQLFGENTQIYSDKIDLCMDHHPSNTFYAKNVLVRDNAAAACEVIFDVINLMNIEITKDIANCLYTGISTDTGCFKYPNTTSKTHIIAAKLIEHGADYQEINRIMFDTKSFERIEVEKAVMDTLEYCFDKKCAMIYLTEDMLEKCNATHDEVEGISSIPRQIQGVEVGVTLKQSKERDAYKISMRTTSYVDASLVCKELGGGGHKRAGGCKIYGDITVAKEKIIEVLKDFI